MTVPRFRISLLGAGRIGRLHARLLSERPDVELTVADAEPGRAIELADALGARSAPVDDALASADALVITAATDAHAELIRAGIARGIPTFCEKPVANDLASTIAIAREVEASDVPVQIGFQRRFDAGYLEARRLVASGELGTLYAFRLAGHDPAPPHEAYIPISGGLFRDFSVHDFDVIRWLTGIEVAEVYATGTVRGFPIFAKYGDVDTAVATLTMADGTIGAMTVARHDPLGYDIRAELFGSRDSVSVGLGPQTPMRSLEPGVLPPSGPTWRDFVGRFEQAYRDELAAFVDVARGARPSPCTAADGLAALRVAEAATLSLHEHRPVRVEEIAQ